MKAKKSKGKVKAKQVNEVVIRIDTTPTVPTVSELTQPMRDGKNLTIPKTWLGEAQIIRMVQSTPKQHVYRRPGKGGKQFDYVTGSYVTKVLNYVFGWNWDFDIVDQGREGNHLWVKGKLTVRGAKQGQEISKTQFGRAEVKFIKGSKDFVDYGNDLKAAATDALKKCASLLGIAGDIYGKAEYKDEANIEVPDAPLLPTPATTITPVEVVKCECGNEVTEAEKMYSLKMYKKILCRDCQALKAAPWKKK